jgi:hypothetical protein
MEWRHGHFVQPLVGFCVPSALPVLRAVHLRAAVVDATVIPRSFPPRDDEVTSVAELPAHGAGREVGRVRFESVRAHPRFARVVSDMKLP